jgi:perosamine synthetase
VIPVNEPVVSTQSKQYVVDCLDTGWISSAGQYVDAFEKKFAEYIGVGYATTVANGTAALHLALAALGIGPNDEVIVPDLTIISCALAPLYVGAKPVLVDVDPDTGNLDPTKIEAAITTQTKAIMVVHLYGHAVDMDPIMAIAKKHGLYVIEDAAEAHGAEYKGRRLGSLGDIACFSFYGNKIVTCGEGGMVVSNHQDLIDKVATLKNLAHSPGKRFWHEIVGYNYRLTNMQAALGLGELENIEKYIAQKRSMRQAYDELLSDIPYLALPMVKPYAASVFWMYNVLVTKDSPISRDDLMKKLKEKGVDTRTYFYPLHHQPVLTKLYEYQDNEFPITNDLSQRGFYLPSGLALTSVQIKAVAQAIQEIFGER